MSITVLCILSFIITNPNLVRLTIGTPGQTFELLPDTGEGNTWVVDKACDPSKSYHDCPEYCFMNAGSFPHFALETSLRLVSVVLPPTLL